MVLTFDVGGTFVKWALADGEEFVQRGKFPTPQGSFDQLVEAVQSVWDALDTVPDGMAFSVPGTVDVANGIIRQGGALQYNTGIAFAPLLVERFGVPVTVENDARCAAYAELASGALCGVNEALVVVVGTGIGGVVISGGEVLRGAHGYAGELSIIPTRPIRANGMDAFLGSHVGMRPLLVRAAGELGETAISGERLMELVRDGDPHANAVLDEALDELTDALFGLQMAFDPEVIAIGGGISADSTYVDRLASKYEELFATFPLPVQHARIVACVHRNDANLLGALATYHKWVEAYKRK